MKKEKSSEIILNSADNISIGDNTKNPTEKLIIQSPLKLCSSCNRKLPKILDKRICPHCQKRTG